MTRLDLDDWAGAIFDLDGVITDTASLHFAAWKETFDDFLRSREGSEPRPFTEEDYRSYVDGRPRYEGVASFLASRDIELPRGQADDPPGEGTVCGLGNAKNERYRQKLAEDEIPVYEDAVELVGALRERAIPAAVVSSSKNCEHVLAQAGLADLFEARVDGVTLAEREDLEGKPAPDMFLEAARQLGVAPRLAAVFEDAEAGVEAGRAGDFGLVVGVARRGDRATREALVAHGADLVVSSLEDCLP